MVQIKINAPSATIILDRPTRCNALDRQSVEELTQAFDDLRQEKKVRGIILAGTGEHFCAGLDLHELNQIVGEQDAMATWFSIAESVRALIEQMLLIPKPIIAAVDGPALGSGFALALSCDAIYATDRSQFAINSARLGIVSGFAMPLLKYRSSPAISCQTALLGENFNADTAMAFGLITKRTPSEQIWVEAHDAIGNIADTSAEAIQLSKRLINEMCAEELSSHLASAASALASSLTTEAAHEGLAAFVDKRPAVFP